MWPSQKAPWPKKPFQLDWDGHTIIVWAISKGFALDYARQKFVWNVDPKITLLDSDHAFIAEQNGIKTYHVP